MLNLIQKEVFAVSNSPKHVVISVGPIPARLDSVKFITNRFKGGLAAKTAEYLADCGFELTIVAWAQTANSGMLGELERHSNVKEVVRIADVFEYYDWFVAHAKDYDAFVMAAAVANLTPVKPWKGKFPSHNYKPGDEFDIKFMIAPRAIDVIKQLNPRACLIGYKLFDAETDEELIQIARHTLADSKANIIFANTPKQARSRKIALTQDGSHVICTFDQHLTLIKRAIQQEYYQTAVDPLSPDELNDPDIKEALAAVELYEQTFKTDSAGRKYGTVAVPVRDRPGMFATTARGHKNWPVIVRKVDFDNPTVWASGKATLNAPALAAMLDNKQDSVIIHRHFSDLDTPVDEYSPDTAHAGFVFPGTEEETRIVNTLKAFDCVLEEHHGYLIRRPIRPIDWTRYHDLFPDKYFSIPDCFRKILQDFVMAETLEIGGNKHPAARYSYDPYVKADTAVNLTWDDIKARQNSSFDLIFARNALNYLTLPEIQTLLAKTRYFIANTFAKPPENIKISDRETAVRAHPMTIRHTLLLPDDSIMRHQFFAYSAQDYERLGLTVTPYKQNSILVTKGFDPKNLM